MSRIRSRGHAATELRFIELLKAAGITGWRRNQKIFGKPDFVFQKLKLAVFVDGCFWHGCPKHCKIPASNRPFWEKKFAANIARDRRVSRSCATLAGESCGCGNTTLSSGAGRVFGRFRPL